MEHQRVRQEPFVVAGISVITANGDGKGVRDIGALWHRFFSSEAGKNAVHHGRTVVGLYTDYEGDASMPYRFVAGYRLEPGEPVPESLNRYEFPGGEFAGFEAKGNPERTVGMIWQAVWDAGLSRAYSTDCELYRHYCWDNPEDCITEVLISLKTPAAPQ